MLRSPQTFRFTVDSFLKFADFFFDGLFADWAVLDHINQAQSRVENTKDSNQESPCTSEKDAPKMLMSKSLMKKRSRSRLSSGN